MNAQEKEIWRGFVRSEDGKQVLEMLLDVLAEHHRLLRRR